MAPITEGSRRASLSLKGFTFPSLINWERGKNGRGRGDVRRQKQNQPTKRTNKKPFKMVTRLCQKGGEDGLGNTGLVLQKHTGLPVAALLAQVQCPLNSQDNRGMGQGTWDVGHRLWLLRQTLT